MVDPFLFSGSIKENICIGNMSATDEDINTIMDKVGISYLTKYNVFTKQNALSGGEKQKISIARALLMNTPFLLLDEPNNNLDSKSVDWLISFIKN